MSARGSSIYDPVWIEPVNESNSKQVARVYYDGYYEPSAGQYRHASRPAQRYVLTPIDSTAKRDKGNTMQVVSMDECPRTRPISNRDSAIQVSTVSGTVPVVYQPEDETKVPETSFVNNSNSNGQVLVPSSATPYKYIVVEEPTISGEVKRCRLAAIVLSLISLLCFGPLTFWCSIPATVIAAFKPRHSNRCNYIIAIILASIALVVGIAALVILIVLVIIPAVDAAKKGEHFNPFYDKDNASN